MTLRRFTVTAVTDASGDVIAYTPFLSGYVSQVQYVKTDYADGVDFTITTETTGQTVWTESNVNSAVVKAPRLAVHSTAGVASTFDGTYPVVDKVAVSRERIKIVVGSGGNTKTGKFHITVDDGK